MKRKAVSIILAGIMIMMCAVGCGKGEENNNSGGSEIVSDMESENREDQEEIKKITVWHYANDREELLQQFAEEYQEKTGVQVVMELYSGDQMSSKIRTAATSGELPDIWYFAGGKNDMNEYAKSGYIQRLDEEWLRERFDENVLAQLTFTDEDTYDAPSGIYGVPFDLNNMQMIYNKDLFAQAGLDAENPPSTWSEFIDACIKLKEKGIIPFATGIGSWGGGSMAQAYQFAYMDMEVMTKTCLEVPEITYEAAGMTKVLELFEDLQENDLLAPSISTMDLPTAEQMFANGQLAILYDGSWVIGVLDSMNPDLNNWGVFPLPQPEDAPYDVKLPGGCSWMVISGNADKAAIDFMEWLTDKDQQIKYSNVSSNLPANKEVVGVEGLKVQAGEFADDMDMVFSYIPANPRAEVSEIMIQGIQMICIGEKKAEDVVKEMDAANK